jgi:hypothetical protein
LLCREDLGFKNSSFISSAMFREFILPSYKKLIAMLLDHGVKIMVVDSDGYNWKLIPLFIEGGVTGMGPMEVAARMDVVEVRKAFPRFQVIGGIDKRIIAEGKAAVELAADSYDPFFPGAEGLDFVRSGSSFTITKPILSE